MSSTGVDHDAIARDLTKALLSAPSALGVAGAGSKYLNPLGVGDREQVLSRTVGYLLATVHAASRSGAAAARAVDSKKAAL